MEEQQYMCLDPGPSNEEGDKGGEGSGEHGGKRKRRLEGEGGEPGSKRPRTSREAREGERRVEEETVLNEEELLLQYQNGKQEKNKLKVTLCHDYVILPSFLSCIGGLVHC